MTDVTKAHERIDQIEYKVNSHGEQIKALSISMRETAESLHENTLLTKQIADNTKVMQDNTEELVYLIKGSKILSRFILTTAAVAGAIYGLYSWLIQR